MVWEKWGEKFGGNNRVCSKIIMEILLRMFQGNKLCLILPDLENCIDWMII